MTSVAKMHSTSILFLFLPCLSEFVQADNCKNLTVYLNSGQGLIVWCSKVNKIKTLRSNKKLYFAKLRTQKCLLHICQTSGIYDHHHIGYSRNE